VHEFSTSLRAQATQSRSTVGMIAYRPGCMHYASTLNGIFKQEDRLPGGKRKLLVALIGVVLFSLSVAAANAQTAPRKLKVMIISLFAPEAAPWIKNLKLEQKMPVAGLSADFPEVLCNADDVCLMTTGMGHTNAAASTMALLFSKQLDLRKSYILIGGIAGMDPAMGTLGTAAWARYLVDFGLQQEIDAREKPAGWSTGYLGIHAADPGAKPPLDYKTEVFQLDELLLQKALKLSANAALMDNDKAAKYRANYPGSPANQPPKIIQCDTLAGDTYWHGTLIGERAHDWVALLTDGRGIYCTTQQEDNAIYEALKRGGAAGLVDLRRVADLRVGANFDRPYPGETADTSLHSSSGGFPIACENIFRAGSPVVLDIVAHWDQWEAGVPQ
jgi:purine nucleoside permease